MFSSCTPLFGSNHACYRSAAVPPPKALWCHCKAITDLCRNVQIYEAELSPEMLLQNSSRKSERCILHIGLVLGGIQWALAPPIDLNAAGAPLPTLDVQRHSRRRPLLPTPPLPNTTDALQWQGHPGPVPTTSTHGARPCTSRQYLTHRPALLQSPQTSSVLTRLG